MWIWIIFSESGKYSFFLSQYMGQEAGGMGFCIPIGAMKKEVFPKWAPLGYPEVGVDQCWHLYYLMFILYWIVSLTSGRPLSGFYPKIVIFYNDQRIFFCDILLLCTITKRAAWGQKMETDCQPVQLLSEYLAMTRSY